MEWLFTSLSHAVEGSAIVAILAALSWGILSVLLSPCHLASIPLIVGFINGQQVTTVRRAFILSGLFAVGILITIATVGGITAMAGRMMGNLGRWSNYAVAIMLLLVGLYLFEILPMPWSGPGQVGIKGRGMLAAFVLGLVFGLALGPCTFAYMAPMLAVTFRLASSDLGYAVVLLVCYGIGHCSVIVMAGTFTEVVQRYLSWDQRFKGTAVLKKVCGTAVILAGLYLLYRA